MFMNFNGRILDGFKKNRKSPFRKYWMWQEINKLNPQKKL